MKKFNIKLLASSLIVASSLFLASCDKAEKTVDAAQHQVQQVTEAAKTAMADGLGYELVPQQLIQELDHAKDSDAKTILTIVEKNYPLFVAEVGGVKYDSPEYQEFAKFNADFLDNMKKSDNLVFSIFTQITIDIKTEADVFKDVNPEMSYGYPLMPTAENGVKYEDFRKQLIENFKKEVLSRLDVYNMPEYQDRYFLVENKEDLPKALETAKATLEGFVKTVDILTANDLVCGKQADDVTKSKCFVDYLTLVAQLPNTMSSVHVLYGNDKQYVKLEDTVSPVFRENIVGAEISFYNLYVDPLQLPEFTAK